MARPQQHGDEMKTVVKESSEIIIVLDISKSMLVEDSKPNGIEKAEMIVSWIVVENLGEKIDTVFFAETAV
jgi:Ca-activated chloride channel family protein